MPSEEEKRVEEEQEAAAAAVEVPAAGDEATEAEKKERHFWPYALALTLLVLAVGGYYTLTSLNTTAQRLGGGADYERLAAGSDEYDSSAGRVPAGGVYFRAEEAQAGSSRLAEDPKKDRLNSAVARAKGQLAAEARPGAAMPSGQGGTPEIPQEIEGWRAPAGQAQGEDPGAESPMASKLQKRAGFGAQAVSRVKPSGGTGTAVAFEGQAALAGRSSVQRETHAAAPRKGGAGGVMDALKGSFRAAFYGARVASQDSAREWTARAFDGSPQAETAIEYDDKMRSKLDKVNPDSIPQFLRDQDVTAAEAKRLSDSKVSDPKLDKNGTYEALQKDQAYQRQKLASNFGGSMLNTMFAGISGTGGPETDPGVFSDPQDQTDLNSMALGEFLQSTGNGEECGCSAAAPCCCLPQDYFNSQQDNCPAYGPFLPNDPCGQSMYGGETSEGTWI